MTRFTEWKITAKAVVLAAGVSALVAGGLAARPTQLVERTSATTDATVPDPACAVPVPYHCDPYPDAASTTTTTSPVPAEVPTTLAPATVVERVTIVEKRLEAVEATTTTTTLVTLPPKMVLTVTSSPDGAQLTWDPVEGAASYSVTTQALHKPTITGCCALTLPSPPGGSLSITAYSEDGRQLGYAMTTGPADLPPVSSESVAGPA